MTNTHRAFVYAAAGAAAVLAGSASSSATTATAPARPSVHDAVQMAAASTAATSAMPARAVAPLALSPNIKLRQRVSEVSPATRQVLQDISNAVANGKAGAEVSYIAYGYARTANQESRELTVR